jgi:hypothetical protein
MKKLFGFIPILKLSEEELEEDGPTSDREPGEGSP